jgi:hypothetical protein
MKRGTGERPVNDKLMTVLGEYWVFSGSGIASGKGDLVGELGHVLRSHPAKQLTLYEIFCLPVASASLEEYRYIITADFLYLC